MTTNPYESPGNSDGAEGSSKSEKRDIGLVVFLSVAALVEAVSGVFAWKSGASSNFADGIYMLTPAVALLFSGVYAVRRFGTVSLRSSLNLLLGTTFMTVLIAACGYVCFGVSCSFVNMAAGFVQTPAPDQHFGRPSIGVGIVSAITMVLSCLLVVAILRLAQKQPQNKSDSPDRSGVAASPDD